MPRVQGATAVTARVVCVFSGAGPGALDQCAHVFAGAGAEGLGVQGATAFSGITLWIC